MLVDYLVEYSYMRSLYWAFFHDKKKFEYLKEFLEEYATK